MSNNERNLDMKELQKGIQMVLAAFNEQKEQYIKIINSLKERIMSLEEEMMKLKEENSLYQNKLYTLQKNIKNISKTIC
jgi:chromosome segregation ATPase